MNDVLLIGVDGGATEVKAHAVACDDPARPKSFQLRPESAARTYSPVPGFAPLPLAEQLAQRDGARIRLSSAETEQGRLWVQAAAQAIAEVAQKCSMRRVLVGIGMPGLKTPDGRGIAVINNGPRIPDYLAALEGILGQARIELASPMAVLGSDADYCGLGEEHAADGLFRDVENAYYVGGGTGLADALKLRGRLVPFDQARSWILKAWQIPSALGPTFEKLVSAGSLNRVYADFNVAAGASPAVASAATFPEHAAVNGDPRAAVWLDTVALVLAELIFERLWTIKNSRADAPHRGEAYSKLNADHEYRGLLLDRVIIGQRVGLIYADPGYRTVFTDKVDACLAAFIAAGGDAEMIAAYLTASAGPPSSALAKAGLIRPSRLRAAPALGAAVAAVQALPSA